LDFALCVFLLCAFRQFPLSDYKRGRGRSHRRPPECVSDARFGRFQSSKLRCGCPAEVASQENETERSLSPSLRKLCWAEANSVAIASDCWESLNRTGGSGRRFEDVLWRALFG
jgi:hypothetical protein